MHAQVCTNARKDTRAPTHRERDRQRQTERQTDKQTNKDKIKQNYMCSQTKSNQARIFGQTSPFARIKFRSHELKKQSTKYN